MNITKLIHSCLLIEHNKKILVDPGSFSWQDEITKETDFIGIHSVVITHNHPDHMDEDFARHVSKSSPEANWYGPQEVSDSLSALGIAAKTTSDDSDIQFIQSDHANLSPWFPTQPQHTSYVLFGDVLIGGDCHTLTSMYGATILAGAINGGPWGGVVGYVQMIQAMNEKPRIVLPLHDWHWNHDARSAIYTRMTDLMAEQSIEFVPLQTGVQQQL